MNFRKVIPLLAVVLGLALGFTARAQTQLSEDFTGATSSSTNGVGNWLASGGACLTAGTQPVAAAGTIPLSIPACVLPTNHSNDVLSTYYSQTHSPYAGDQFLVGGSTGYLGSNAAPSGTSIQNPDALGSGALRFTNGYRGGATGKGQNGSIVSANTYPTGSGLQVTFKTVTYLGDSGGAAGDGADGISFYLLDGCMPLAGTTPPANCFLSGSNPNLTIYGESNPTPSPFQQFGAWGGSLAYTCSNSNTPHDGLSGAYLGLGIDEYGNFLNGSSNTQGTSWSATGDNTATGGGYKPSRIGLRGAGNISWQALTNAYGAPVSPGDTIAPYYTNATCATGKYDSVLNLCETCTTGTYSGAGTGTCSVTSSSSNCPVPPVGSGYAYTYNGALGTSYQCVACPTGSTYSSTTNGTYPYGSCTSTSASSLYLTTTAPSCPGGAYDSALSQCVSCPSGSTLSGSSSATPSCSAVTPTQSAPSSPTCSSGTYDSALGYCIACPFGALQGGSTATPSCSAPAVTKTPRGGSSPSFTCAIGVYDPALSGSNRCVSCPAGSTLSGQTTSSPSCSAAILTNTGLPTGGSCSGGGTFDGALGKCVSCPSGSLSGQTTSSPSCSAPIVTLATACAAGTTLTNNMCNKCASGTVYSGTTSGSFPYGYCSVPGQPTSEAAALLNTTTPAAASAPSSVSASVAQLLVQATCQTGHLFNYNALVNALGSPSGWTLNNLKAGTTPYSGNTTLPTASDGNGNAANPLNTAGILDYPTIPGGYQVLSGTTSSGQTIQIANEGATTRAVANTILYNLKIAPNGLLSLSYSFNGAAYQSIIKNQSITASNGALPDSVRYGFAGSTGGSSNVHEIMCFKSQPVNQSQSSVGVNQRQSAEIQPTGSFAYFSFYDTLDWTGRVTANALGLVNGDLVVNQTPTWDGSCTLSGIATGQTCSTGAAGPVAAAAPASRVVLSYGASGGVPFEAPGSAGGGITVAQLANLNLGDTSSSNLNRLNYLRGDTSNELTNSGTPCPQYVAPSMGSPGTPCFRPRDSVLGDIVDSSPVWVGPPQLPYTAAWRDKLYSSASNPEALTGATSYQSYISAEQTRTNVVYVGANDGMLHGFRSGSFNASGVFDTTSSGAPNDGTEVLAYVPGALLQSVSNGSTAGCASNPMASTLSTAQNIHGVTPAIGSTAACTASSLDYSNQNYGHNFFVDATPGSGDLFYNNAWHTWLVGGLGAGGAAVYALDVTDPGTGTTNNFTEANAAHLVIGEWTPANMACVGDTSGNACATKLGSVYGMPIIRRLHDGRWALIFGNGLGSAAGDAGIFVMTISGYNGTSQLPTMTTYYLSTATGSTGSPNGIASVTSADLDGDHIADYVYAGDLQGNLWRFDLTSQSESNWAVTPGALFKTPTGQPITTQVVVASGTSAAGANTLMIGLGTGQKTPVSNVAAVNYQQSQQSLYGVWDWNMGTATVGWNAHSPTQYASLTSSTTNPPPYTYTLSATQLDSIAVSANATAYTVNGASLGENSGSTSQTPVCWAGTPSCTGTAAQYGWSLNLPGAQVDNSTSPATQTYEQIVFNPLVDGVAFQVNSTVPAINSTTQCTTHSDQGYSYSVSMMNGNAIPNFFTKSSATQYHNTNALAEQTDATGTSFPVTTANGQHWLVYQTVGNAPATLQVNMPPNYQGRRLTWVQLR